MTISISNPTPTTTRGNDAAAVPSLGFGPAAALEPSRDPVDVACGAAKTLAKVANLNDTQGIYVAEFYRLDYKYTFFATVAAILDDADEEEADHLRAQYRRDANRFARRAVQIWDAIRDHFNDDTRDALFDIRRTVIEIAHEEARLVANGILFPIYYRREVYNTFYFEFMAYDLKAHAEGKPFDDLLIKNAIQRRDDARDAVEYYERAYPDICRTTREERDELARKATAAIR